MIKPPVKPCLQTCLEFGMSFNTGKVVEFFGVGLEIEQLRPGILTEAFHVFPAACPNVPDVFELIEYDVVPFLEFFAAQGGGEIPAR